MLTARVCTIERPGGPEVIEWREIELNGEPANDELLIRHTAVGLNYIDTYHRSGLYPLPMPSGLPSNTNRWNLCRTPLVSNSKVLCRA